MPYSIDLTHANSVPTAVIRGRVQNRELAQFVPTACGEVWAFAKAARLPKPGRHVALYLDAEGNVEVGAEVTEPFASSERVHLSALPGGRVATTVHWGPYSRLGEAHAAIRAWCAAQGLRCTGVSWELYGHWEASWNSDPSMIRTDVFYLLEAARER